MPWFVRREYDGARAVIIDPAEWRARLVGVVARVRGPFAGLDLSGPWTLDWQRWHKPTGATTVEFYIFGGGGGGGSGVSPPTGPVRLHE